MRNKYISCVLIIFVVLIVTMRTTSAKSSNPSTPAKQMVQLLTDIRNYSKSRSTNFIMLGNGASSLMAKYPQLFNSLDGLMVESMFYGGGMKEDVLTSKSDTNYHKKLLKLPLQRRFPVFNLDYCHSAGKIRDAYQKANSLGVIESVSSRWELDIPYGMKLTEKPRLCRNLKDVKSFLVMLNPGRYSSVKKYIDALAATRQDMLIIDLYFGGTPLTKQQVKRLKTRADGKRRLVLAYMSVGEAETYRPYWKKAWNNNPPAWLSKVNKDWGSYRVKYWNPQWKSILYGNSGSYLDKIIAASFDGVFIDTIDSYSFFESVGN